MPWNTEFVVRRDLGNPVLKTWSLSSRSMFNCTPTRWDWTLPWMKFRRPSIEQPQLFSDVQRTFTIGTKRKKKWRRRIHSMKWSPKIRKLWRSFSCWLVRSRAQETRCMNSCQVSRSSLGCGLKTSLTISSSSQRRTLLYRITRMPWSDSQTLKKILRKLRPHTKLEQWSWKLPTFAVDWDNMLRTGRLNTVTIFIRGLDLC